MSTKVYTAYKIDGSKHDIWEVLRTIRKKGVEQVQLALRERYTKYLTDESYHKSVTEYLEISCKTPVELSHISRYFSMLYKEQITSFDRNPWNFDVNVTVRGYKGNYYLIPYCDMFMNKTLDFLNDMEEVQNYCYWDNVDPDERCSEKEWEERKVIWTYFTEADRWADYLVLEICDHGGFYKIDPWREMTQEMRNEE